MTGIGDITPMSRIRGARKKDSLLEAIEARARELTPPPEPDKPILKAAVKRTKSELIKYEDALVRLEIAPSAKEAMELIESFPNITNAFSDIGGVPAVLEYLKSSDATEARTLLRKWGEIAPTTRELLPFEAFVVAAKCSRKRMLQIIIGEVSEQSSAEAVLLAAVKHKDIVQKTINVALSNDFGATDARKVMHQHRKFLPTPKNQVVNIGGDMTVDNRQDNRQIANVSVASLDQARDKIAGAVDRFNKGRQQLSGHTEHESDEDFMDAEEA